MKKKLRSYLAVILSVCLVVGGITVIPQNGIEADELTNVANGRSTTTFMTSNANNGTEGFCYIGNGFSAINCVNETLTNGNNMLGATATTDEVAIYIDLGSDYDISNARIYQGSTNSSYYDSYCRNFEIYYSAEQVSADNEGNITWALAGECNDGTIYNASTTKINSAAYTSTTGDYVEFDGTYTAKSVKIVFDKDSCMGTGNGDGTGTTGTVSLLSVRIYGLEHTEDLESSEATTTETTTESTEKDDTLYASYTTDLALKSNNSSVKGYASSNLRTGVTTPLTVNNLTNGSITGSNYIIANTTGKDTNPWFAVDLGAVYDINKVVITPGADSSTYVNAYPISYEIQVAIETTDISSASDIKNLTWTTVAQVTDGTLAAKSLTFARQNARYVRLIADEYADYCSLYEFSVYETDDSRLLEEEDEIMNVLFIGNSMTYYNTLCNVVQELATLQGKSISCTASTAGGRNLIYHTTYSQTVLAIQSGAYDVVVLQDIVGSFDGDDLLEGATTLTEMIKRYNPDAEVVLYMPWPVEGSLTGKDSLLPYFTYNYIKTARSLGAGLAPAGEAWYVLYNEYPDVAWYCDDEKHPHAIGTFVSACSVYYALYTNDEQITVNEENADDINQIINDNIAYSGDAVQTYDTALLNDIAAYTYKYVKSVKDSVDDDLGSTKYTSVAGEYTDADDEVDKTGLSDVTGDTVDSSVFTAEDNIAIGCDAYASSGSGISNVTDAKTGTRWESEWQVDPQWIYVDLGEEKYIDKVGFIWEGAYASKYYIQVSDDATDWTTVAMVTASSASTVQIDIENGTSARYVRMYGTRRGLSAYGYSIYEFGVWEEYQVSIDGNEEYVSAGSTYTLKDAEYGYYSSGVMYPSGYEYTVDDNVSFTSVNEMSVTMTQGAGIRLEEPYGIRFQATISSDNMTAVANQSVIKEGMLITTSDYYYENGYTLNLTGSCPKTSVENSGWYNNTTGVYCGSLVNINESNYARSFVARAYVTIQYADGTEKIVYSETSPSRSIQYVAQVIIDNNYENIAEDKKAIIDMFAQ